MGFSRYKDVTVPLFSFSHLSSWECSPEDKSALTALFRSQNSRCVSQLRTKNIILCIYKQTTLKTVLSSNYWHFGRNRLLYRRLTAKVLKNGHFFATFSLDTSKVVRQNLLIIYSKFVQSLQKETIKMVTNEHQFSIIFAIHSVLLKGEKALARSAAVIRS